MKARNVALALFAACLALDAAADVPSVSQVTVRQRWPWSRLVDINYVLACDPAQRVDVAVSGFNGSVPLNLPVGAFAGDLYGVAEGARRIVFDPTKTAYTNSEVMTQFRVSLTPVFSPLYLIVDLTKSLGAEGQLTYVYEEDLASGAYGAVETNFVPAGVEAIIWTGVTNDVTYMTDKLVLRRVPAGTFLKGGTTATPVPSDYYIGIFELTQRQRYHITGTYNSSAYYTGSDRDVHPEVRISYNAIRGSTNDTPSVNWPYTGTLVTESSIVGRLRTRTGLDFDIPTDTQWEYACRAGTTTKYNNGSNADAAMDELGWYSGNVPSTTQTYPVGQLKPNAWGLYDMHGGAEELCRDWYDAEETQRNRRNGSFSRGATFSTSTYRFGVAPTANGGTYGTRMVVTLPAPMFDNE
jgi:hypothetical protein